MSNEKTKHDARAEKRAAALRDNLRRRKEAQTSKAKAAQTDKDKPEKE